ncbi:ABC transporter substrate-binding protein, partial [Streptomyces koyangensis]
MRRTSFTRTATLLTSFITATALLSGCAGSAESTPNAQPVTNGLIGEQPDGSDPTPGGNLSYATFSAVTSLDPANRQDSGTTGGTEMAAIYDLLVRYDRVAEEYLPQLAQSLETNADASQWTLTLRPNAKFSDGTPVDSAAVRWSIDRYLGKNGTQTQVWKTSVADMTAPDASTVVFTLQRPWREFPIMLTSGPGMIVAPSSM